MGKLKKRPAHMPLRYKLGPRMTPWQVAHLFPSPWKSSACPFKSWSLRNRFKWCLNRNRRAKESRDV